jgi:hypothetical protein
VCCRPKVRDRRRGGDEPQRAGSGPADLVRDGRLVKRFMSHVMSHVRRFRPRHHRKCQRMRGREREREKREREREKFIDNQQVTVRSFFVLEWTTRG